MEPVAVGLYIASYLLAVIDGSMDHGARWSSGKPIGLRKYVKWHPWTAAGAVCGVVATVLMFAT